MGPSGTSWVTLTVGFPHVSLCSPCDVLSPVSSRETTPPGLHGFQKQTKPVSLCKQALPETLRRSRPWLSSRFGRGRGAGASRAEAALVCAPTPTPRATSPWQRGSVLREGRLPPARPARLQAEGGGRQPIKARIMYCDMKHRKPHAVFFISALGIVTLGFNAHTQSGSD